MLGRWVIFSCYLQNENIQQRKSVLRCHVRECLKSAGKGHSCLPNKSYQQILGWAMGQSQWDHPRLLSSEKQQYKELEETISARAMAGWAEREHREEQRWAGLSRLSQQPERSSGEMLLWRKSAAGRKEGEIRQRPLLTAHRHHRDLLQPQSQHKARRQCTASTHVSLNHLSHPTESQGSHTWDPSPCPVRMLHSAASAA